MSSLLTALLVVAIAAGCASVASPESPVTPSAPTSAAGLPSLAAAVSAAPSPSLAVVAETTRLAVPPAGKLYVGVYPGARTGEEDDLTPRDLRAYEKASGRRVAWVYFSNNWYRDRAFPTATATWIRRTGAVPYVRLMLRSDAEQNHAEPLFTLRAIAAGTFDDDLARWTDGARAFTTPIIAEFGTEMNGEWFSWNERWNRPDGAAAFREAYRHIVLLARARGATNITWVFHVNGDDSPLTAENRMEGYYPGSDVIDWVGLSSYGAQTPADSESPDLVATLDAMVPRLALLAPAKPIMLLEFGVTARNPHVNQAAWADRALGALIGGRWPQLRGFSWWNETWQNDGIAAHDTDMRVQASKALTGVFRRRLSSRAVVDRPVFSAPSPAP